MSPRRSRSVPCHRQPRLARSAHMGRRRPVARTYACRHMGGQCLGLALTSSSNDERREADGAVGMRRFASNVV